MDEAARLATAGAPAGTIVVADEQSAGRGRGGRSWSAPAGSAILASVILRPVAPPRTWPMLTLLAGVAVAETIEAATGQPAWLKWPNDVWLGNRDDGRKVAGILLTSRPGAPGASPSNPPPHADPVSSPTGLVIVGIGINVNTADDDLPPGAASLRQAAGRCVEREAVMTMLWRRLDARNREYERTGGAPDLAPWRRRAALIGERVSVLDHVRENYGVVLGITSDGRLRMQSESGGHITVVAGDLSRGPRRTS